MKPRNQLRLGMALLSAAALWILPASSAKAQTCNEQSLVTTVTPRVTKFIQDLKIAKSRGDAETMLKSFHENYELFLKPLLEQCPKPMRVKICSYECQKQIAEYYYFQAADVPYYLNTTRPDLQAPERLLEFATQGIDFIKNNRAASKDEAPGDFRDYLLKGGFLNLLLTRLYMTAGDILYQQTSEPRLQRLQYLTAEATGRELEKDYLKDAQAFYNKANWELQSAALEIPQSDAFFSSLAVDSLSLQNELGQRLNSIKKGYLFLDIDPEEFTQVPFAELRLKLDDVMGRLLMAEQNIESLRSRWVDAKAGNDVEKINEDLRKRDVSVAQSAYRIAQLEGLASKMSDEISSKLNSVEASKDSLAYEQNKFEFQFQLKLKMEELDNRAVVIEKQNEIEMLQIDQTKTERKLNDLRWFMDWQIAVTNLKIQVSQLESEIANLDSQIKVNDNRKNQAENRKGINDLSINSSHKTKEDSLNQETALRREKVEIAEQQLIGLESQICSTHVRLSFLGMTPPAYRFKKYDCQIPQFTISETQYNEQMCGAKGLREQMSTQEIKTVANALCQIGIDTIPAEFQKDPEVASMIVGCPGKLNGQTSKDFANAILTKELNLANAEIHAATEARNRMIATIKEIQKIINISNGTRGGLELALSGLEAAAVGLTMIPETTVCICGLGSGTSTRFPAPKEGALIAVDALRGKLDRFVNWAQFQAENQKEILNLNNQLKEYENSLETVRFSTEVRKYHSLQAIAEITGQSLNTRNQVLERMLQKGMTVLDCRKQVESTKENVASVTAEHSRLVAEVAALGYRNENLDLSIASELLKRQREDNTIGILELENKNLQLDIASIETETETLRKVKTHANSRKTLLTNLQSDVNDMEKKGMELSTAVTELENMRKDKVVALSNTEIDQVKKVIQNNQSFTQNMVQFADRAYKLEVLDLDLRNELLAFKSKIAGDVASERGKIIDSLNAQEKVLSSGAREKVFLASEENMAEFEKGVPAFVQEKRDRLKEANRLLILLRNQVNNLAALKGENPLSLSHTDPVITVKNHTDAVKIKSLLELPLWDNKQQIITKTARITVPFDSAFARQLASQQRASFEISPFSRGQMDGLGYYSMWSTDFDGDAHGLSQNLLLIDMNMVVKVSNCPDAESKRFVIKHSGQGVVFKEASETDATMLPQLVISASRKYAPSYYTPSDLTVDNIRAFWTKTFFINNFLKGDPPPNFSGMGSIPPLLGLPLIGQYEITLDNPNEGCSYQNAGFTLYFTYAVQHRD
ncbi:MAG TPA: hypothetical protein VE954_09245 [Oligoflexus sp.]|uniref:hypothetical protein n=1 Tax=Oligoflexus sp. TaxID=1971216 RepID=UPI002D515C13|nr:hypothetical protein [Oligoflexus sp.]HYX33286.1 hypothetical protein [Oligoflexus sp.]